MRMIWGKRGSRCKRKRGTHEDLEGGFIDPDYLDDEWD